MAEPNIPSINYVDNVVIGPNTVIEDVLGSPFDDTIMGNDAANLLSGGAGNDILNGRGGDDTLTGGAGADSFVITPGGGADTVTDFSHAQGDHIDLSAFASLHRLSDILAASSQVGANTLINLGGGSVTLQGVQLSSLTAQDFLGYPAKIGATGINNHLVGGLGADYLQGQGGNDTLQGGGGSNYLDGGAGIDTAVYTAPWHAYTVDLSADGPNVTGGLENAVDTLVNIERIQFADGYLTTGTGDTAAEVYRLYGATLGRAPDPLGLVGWTNALNNGSSTLTSVVSGFVNSPEFQARYGTLDNTGFVTLLYHNVLGRDPDTGGLAGWLNALNGGSSRSQVVLGFSESPEYITDTAPAVQQGLWVGDAGAAEVARLYDTVLGRLPDAAGEAGWTQAIDSGSMSLLQVTQGFVASTEFQATYGSLNDSNFVQRLYQNTLHRPADTAGLNGWTNNLAGGMSRAQVVLGFSESAEHIANTAAQINNGVLLA